MKDWICKFLLIRININAFKSFDTDRMQKVKESSALNFRNPIPINIRIIGLQLINANPLKEYLYESFFLHIMSKIGLIWNIAPASIDIQHQIHKIFLKFLKIPSLFKFFLKKLTVGTNTSANNLNVGNLCRSCWLSRKINYLEGNNILPAMTTLTVWCILPSPFLATQV